MKLGLGIFLLIVGICLTLTVVGAPLGMLLLGLGVILMISGAKGK